MGVPSLASLNTGALASPRANHGLDELFGEQIARSALTDEGLLSLVYDPLLFSGLVTELNSTLHRDELKAFDDAHAPKMWRTTFLPRLEFKDHGRFFELTTSYRVHHRKEGTLVKVNARVLELCAAQSESVARKQMLTLGHFYESLNNVPAEHHVLLPLVRHVAAMESGATQNVRGLRQLFVAVLRAGDPLYAPIESASLGSIARDLQERLDGLTAEGGPRLDATVKALDHSAKKNQGDGSHGFVAVILADTVAFLTASAATDALRKSAEDLAAKAEPPAEA